MQLTFLGLQTRSLLHKQNKGDYQRQSCMHEQADVITSSPIGVAKLDHGGSHVS